MTKRALGVICRFNLTRRTNARVRARSPRRVIVARDPLRGLGDRAAPRGDYGGAQPPRGGMGGAQPPMPGVPGVAPRANRACEDHSSASRSRRDHLVAANLTRDEARTRAELITVSSYQVELDLTVGDATFRSVSRIGFDCGRPGARTFVNLAALEVHAITLNGAPVSLNAFDGERITLSGLAAHNELVVDADCGYSRSGEGLHRFADPADGNVYLFSDLETFDAHRIYACFDQPDMKATYQLTVLAPEGWLVVSNMAPEVEGGIQ